MYITTIADSYVQINYSLLLQYHTWPIDQQHISYMSCGEMWTRTRDV